MNQGPDFYTRLGISRDATPEEVRRAYRESARRLHPDLNALPGETELFLDAQEAYETISDPEKRAKYDATLPPEQPSPISVKVLYSRASIPRMDEPQILYTLLELKGKIKVEATQAPPLNLGLVVDCSTSMQGEYFDTVKSTAIELIRQLREKDVFSLVVFNDQARVIVPAGARIERGRIEMAIRMLQTAGSTEILKGLDAGFFEVQRIKKTSYINHLILITDGHTYGDEKACLDIADRAQNDGIGISALGIGGKWNDKFLDTLTSRTGGSSQFVSQPVEVRQFLKDKVLALSSNFADNISMNITTQPGVKIQYVFRILPEAAMLDIESPIQLGSIPLDNKLSVIFELLLENTSKISGELDLAQGYIKAFIPSFSEPISLMRTRLALPTSDGTDLTPPPIIIMQALSRLTLYRMQEKAREEAAAGDIQAASRRMQLLATNLLSRGENDLAKTVMQEINHLQFDQHVSEEGQKQIKYGTRSLFNPDVFIPEIPPPDNK